MAGLLIIGFADNNILCLFGFALAGIVFPIWCRSPFQRRATCRAGAGVGLSVVTTMGYSGILVAPSLIGFIAQHTSLGLVFRGLPVLLLVVLLLSGLARHADRAEEQARGIVQARAPCRGLMLS